MKSGKNSIHFTWDKAKKRLADAFRFNHWRGHGIHSPAVYKLVRETIIEKRENSITVDTGSLAGNDARLVRSLSASLGLTPQWVSESPAAPGLWIAPDAVSAGRIGQWAEEAEKAGEPVYLIVNKADKQAERFYLCQQMAQERQAVCLDLHKTCIFLFDPRLEKRYYRIRG